MGKKNNHSVAKVIEISANSPHSFEDAVKNGIKQASKSVKNIRAAWVKDQSVEVQDGKVSAFRVNLKVTFELKG